MEYTWRCIFDEMWIASDLSGPVVPSPEDFAWSKVDDDWTPVWLEIPEVSKLSKELIHKVYLQGALA